MQFPNTVVLLSVAIMTATEQTGLAYAVIPTTSEDTSFRAWVEAAQQGGATSPKTKIILETSNDGTHWVECMTAPELTVNSTVSAWVEVPHIGRFIRARSALSGGTLPSHTVVVKLGSNHHISIKRYVPPS